MLRSVFTLMQNFFDVTSNEIEFIRSKRRRSNNTLVKYSNHPDFVFKMDLELKGDQDGDGEQESKLKAEVTDKGDIPKTSFVNQEKLPEDDGQGLKLRQLLTTPPKLQEKLAETNRQLIDKGKDNLQLLLEQVNKMKTGIHRLQEIAQSMSQSDTFKENIEYLIKNVGPALEKAELDAKLKPNKKN